LPAARHVAIIMDGNGRWAKARGLPRTAGHQRGAEAVRRTVAGATELGVSYLTLYGFSSENWKRPAAEIDDLGPVALLPAQRDRGLDGNGVRLRVIGDRAKLGTTSYVDRRRRGAHGTQPAPQPDGGRLRRRWEIALAAGHIAAEASAGRLRPEDVDEALFSRYLLTAGMPDPDLVIRTSGEKRVSNFLLWQCAYAELVFVDRLWPDFTRDDLEDAISEFRGRDRRYGAQG
jgi:undecaprenyl diphosphate synthase